MCVSYRFLEFCTRKVKSKSFSVQRFYASNISNLYANCLFSHTCLVHTGLCTIEFSRNFPTLSALTLTFPSVTMWLPSTIHPSTYTLNSDAVIVSTTFNIHHWGVNNQVIIYQENNELLKKKAFKSKILFLLNKKNKIKVWLQNCFLQKMRWGTRHSRLFRHWMNSEEFI